MRISDWSSDVCSSDLTPENEEAALIAALDAAERRARAAVEAEDFEGAMEALASLRGPVDAFFDKVTVTDPDQITRTARLNPLARMSAPLPDVPALSQHQGQARYAEQQCEVIFVDCHRPTTT